MAQRAMRTEAKKSGTDAVTRGMHRSTSLRSRQAMPPMVRMPSNFTTRDVEVILEALWHMFTEAQARKLVVAAPWDDSDDPPRMTLSAVAAVFAHWVDAPERG